MTIEQMQEAILRDGWQYREQVFNDEHWADCSLEFTRDKSPHALSNYPRPKDCIGWGRFTRSHAWLQAYTAIIVDRKYGRKEGAA